MYGKLPPKPQGAAPKHKALWSGKRIEVPPIYNYTVGLTQYPMFLNDHYGCCTWAAVANRERVLRLLNTGEEYILPDQCVLAHYLEMTGGLDTGLYITDVLTNLATKGLALPDRQSEDVVRSWATIDYKDPEDLRLATYACVGIITGWNLPDAADVLFDHNQEFSVPSNQALIGDWAPKNGHAMYLAGYDPNGFWVITWGHPVHVTNEFAAAYMDEAYALLSPQVFNTSGVSPAGLNWETLTQDVACLGARA